VSLSRSRKSRLQDWTESLVLKVRRLKN